MSNLVWPVCNGKKDAQITRLCVLILNYLTCIQGVPMRALDVNQDEEAQLRKNILQQMRQLMRLMLVKK